MKNIRKTKKNQVRKRKLSILRGGERNNTNILHDAIMQKLPEKINARDARFEKEVKNNKGQEYDLVAGKYKISVFASETAAKGAVINEEISQNIVFKINVFGVSKWCIIYEQEGSNDWKEVEPRKEEEEEQKPAVADNRTPGKLKAPNAVVAGSPAAGPTAADKYTIGNFESLLKEMSQKHHDGILLGKLDENSFNENKFNSNVGKFNLESKTKVDPNIYDDNIKNYVPPGVTLSKNYEEIHQQHHEAIQKFMYADIYSLYNLFKTNNTGLTTILRGIDITQIDGSKYHNKETITIGNIVDAVTA